MAAIGGIFFAIRLLASFFTVDETTTPYLTRSQECNYPRQAEKTREQELVGSVVQLTFGSNQPRSSECQPKGQKRVQVARGGDVRPRLPLLLARGGRRPRRGSPGVRHFPRGDATRAAAFRGSPRGGWYFFHRSFSLAVGKLRAWNRRRRRFFTSRNVHS